MAIWVVVADTAKARVFQQETVNGALTETLDLTHPEARVAETQLASDGPGVQATAGGHGIHAMQEKNSPREVEDQRFAKLVMDTVRDALNKGKISSFYVAAPPRFLGRLREEMDSRLSKALKADVGKNLSLATAEVIHAEFFNA